MMQQDNARMTGPNGEWDITDDPWKK